MYRAPLPFLRSHRPHAFSDDPWRGAMADKEQQERWCCPSSLEVGQNSWGLRSGPFPHHHGFICPTPHSGILPFDVLLSIHRADSGPKCSQRAKVRHLSGKNSAWCQLIFFFFPASELAGLSALLTLWRNTVFLLTQIRVLSSPSPSTYTNHPPLGSFPLLPGSCSCKDLRISSRTALCLWKDRVASDLLITFPRGECWRLEAFWFFFFPPSPLSFWDRQPSYKQARVLSTGIHNMMPPKCAPGRIFSRRSQHAHYD